VPVVRSNAAKDSNRVDLFAFFFGQVAGRPRRQPEVVENVLRALIEGLAFTWAPRSKSAVLKSVMRRLRITETAFAEDGYQDLLTRGGLEKKPYPSFEGLRNVQRLTQSANPRAFVAAALRITGIGIYHTSPQLLRTYQCS